MSETVREDLLDFNDTTTQVQEADFPWALFSVKDVVYGIHSSYVLSIEILDKVTQIVESPHYIRGMTNFRGNMVKLNDLRSFFGLPGRIEEIEQILTPKIEAHNTWVNTLRECVAEQKPFTLATDPHNCAFGKWYYNFKSDSSTLNSYLTKIEAPHARLHDAGGKIMKLVEAGRQEEAETMLSEVVEPTFQETMSLLSGIIGAYCESMREMLIVLELDGEIKGIIVDDIVAVEYINEMLSVNNNLGDKSFIKRLGKRQKDGSPIQLIDEDYIKLM